ncbi:RNI-like protein [Dichomitus squalens LYAD-421 SS1]|uniref:RNI-like protein n=1 Tax=Dichomitus squalens (strain LYAD-421) TaxID=732165 RepID=UPI0004412DB5|nr:RNI-like protein [Dichomitus squalens LYAD-421 SS1]EJF63717.1 RNI-like protein [Dichomitus squalens LYAD-421 SS1]
MLSPSASSSAVTIPTPGKSILKRPPPPQQSFFSLARLSKLLPTQTQQPSATNDETSTLKRAHFILPEMTTVYPILAANPPSTPTLKEEKKSIEERELERRKRIVRGNSISTDSSQGDDWWTMEKVEAFYRECCVGREEAPDPAISAAFKRAASTHPRTIDFSGIQLNLGVASVLSDVFTIEWGLRKLVFKECDLDDIILKPILHSLLIPGTLTFLSVSSNRRLKAPAFRLIGAYVTKAKTLQFLDLSQNALDKKSIEYIAAALPEAPTPGLVSLRLDDCQLKPQALDALAHSVRKSSLRNISLRHNRISATGAVAIALMIKDYPDRFPSTNENGSTPPSPATSTSSFSPFNSPPPTPTTQTRSLPGLTIPNGTPAAPPKPGPILPPPRHPATAPQTTYTPYIPRARRGAAAAVPTPGNTNPLSPSGKPIPIIASSAQGGVIARHPVPPPPSHPASTNGRTLEAPLKHGPSAALLEQVRALDNLPRLGALQTLDLKGNDIRTGITYIAQVLKRNRTLKVLNLSENKLDVQGLVAVAEALKYNSCLETLDLSKNPCCGPGLEGIQSLRTAFTLNNALKRLFLSSTSMTSAGAIALAEFLPESASLLHLDLTMNNLDLAGVMALSSGLRANHVMRCLDLNIPPGDEGMARMCRDILESCVRNTEEAEKASQAGTGGRGEAKGVWGMLEQSELAKSIREDDKKKVEGQIDTSSLLSSRDPTDIPSPPTEQTEADLVLQARTRKTELEDLLARTPSSSSSSAPLLSIEGPDAELLQTTREMMRSIVSAIERTTDSARLESLLTLNDELMNLLGRLEPKPEGLKLQGVEIQPSNGDAVGNGHTGHTPEGSASSAQELEPPSDDEPITPRLDKGKRRAEPEPEPVESVLSPTFLITESDDEEGGTPPLTADPEELVSPTDLSRRLVEEEGEVFRKGAVLLTTEDMEGEYDSEELRKELLEAMVERPPPRMVDEYGAEVPPPLDKPISPLEEPKKPPPRPYIRRSRSSSSTPSIDGQSVVSPVDNARSLPGSVTASPISPSAAKLPLLGRRSSTSSISSSIQEAPEPTT